MIFEMLENFLWISELIFFDLVAIANLSKSLKNDLVSLLETIFDHEDVILRALDRDVALMHDIVFADDDGCVFVGAEFADDLLRVAREIWQRERHQADAIKSGHSLREQLEFARYLEKRATDPGYTFREHLRKISGAIEE